MRKSVLPITAIVLFTSGSVAFAATATGTILGVNHSKNKITLDTGTTYLVPGSSLSNLKSGERVKIEYNKVHGARKATKVTPEG